jgi:hypothetical protein
MISQPLFQNKHVTKELYGTLPFGSVGRGITSTTMEHKLSVRPHNWILPPYWEIGNKSC